jgi:hypothetical protein
MGQAVRPRVDVYTHAIQLADGRIDDGTAEEPPGISLDIIGDGGRLAESGVTVSGAGARVLAAALLECADELERWAGNQMRPNTI